VKHAVELGDGLETGAVCHIGDAHRRFAEQLFGFLDPRPSYEFEKGHSGRVAEKSAEVVSAQVYVQCDLVESHWFGNVCEDKSFRAGDCGRVGRCACQKQSGSRFGQLIGEKIEQARRSLKLFFRHHWHLGVCPLGAAQGPIESPLAKPLNEPTELARGRPALKDAAGQESCHMTAFHQHWYCQLSQTRKTTNLLRHKFSLEAPLEFFLERGAGLASPGIACQQCAKRFCA
jgi:hypothetical protein